MILFHRTRHIAIAGLCLMLAILACGQSVTPDQVRILDAPQFICPSSTPPPTHTALPTQVQPPVQVPPSGYATYTPVPGCVWTGSFCLPFTPFPGGIYTTPAHWQPGATSTLRATFTPPPSPTADVRTGGFHVGADVYTGGFASAVNVRLQVRDIQVHAISDREQVVSWVIELENVGAVPYVALPGGQVFVAEIETPTEYRAGQWWASQSAAHAIGFELQDELLDVLEVAPGDLYRLTLTAFTPIGTPTRIGWALDPLGGSRDGDLTGGNVVYWDADAPANCTGNPDTGVIVPTPIAPPPTATATATPRYPAWCSWCGF